MEKEKDKSKFIFPQYISTTDKTVTVAGIVENEDDSEDSGVFIDGKGYVDKDGIIWIYCGCGKPKNANEYPYFWISEDGKKTFSDPQPEMKEKFNTDNMKSSNLYDIVEATQPNEVLFDEEEINDVNSASASFIPIINESDDFLKKLIKATIIMKGIDINRLKVKAEQKYMLPNMKAALINDTKMSVVYFNKWAELLGTNFEVAITDSGEDKVDPLKRPLVYQSITNNVGELISGHVENINSGKLISAEDVEE